VYSGEIIQT